MLVVSTNIVQSLWAYTQPTFPKVYPEKSTSAKFDYYFGEIITTHDQVVVQT